MQSIAHLTGEVKEGNKRGKRLGFPTINMSVDQQLDEGIYISQTEIAGKQYNSLTFIGAAKTFNEEKVKAESYMFDFNQDIYGQQVTVFLLKKIRDNERFDSEEALVKQMEEDKRQAEEFFKES